MVLWFLYREEIRYMNQFKSESFVKLEKRSMDRQLIREG